MDWLQALILGIVQGLTEFLPVSSSGHLVIFQKLLGLREHSLAFDVAAHLGTLASVMTIYYKFLKDLTFKSLSSLKQKTLSPEANVALMVIVATVPTAIIGLTFKDRFEALFSNLFAVGVCLLLTGSLLLMTRWKTKTSATSRGIMDFSTIDMGYLNWKVALIIGFAQGGAIAPGISRSGTTIAVALLLGLPANIAAMFSFMLAIPAILGAGVLQLKDLHRFDSQVLQTLGLGFGVSYVAGLAGLWCVLHFVKKGRLEMFTIYVWLLGAISIYWAL